jgi:hypothetical protein
MRLDNRTEKTVKWIARISAAIVVLFGLPFYFGYGNPMPFIDPAHSFMENLWLTVFPLMFIGLILGWKFEKIGGYLIAVPITIGLAANLLVYKELTLHMLIPLFIGMLYLTVGYSNSNTNVRSGA